MNYSADPLQDFQIRETAGEAARAAALSQAEGRAVDAFGFPARGVDAPAVGHTESRADRLARARFLNEVKAEAEAERAVCFRAVREEFELPNEILTPCERWPEVWNDRLKLPPRREENRRGDNTGDENE